MSQLGVSFSKRKDGTHYYRASLTFKNKHISLGSFSTEAAAHACYLFGKELLSSTVAIADYVLTDVLSFDKWVILINFRDSGYYFPNPIYLHKKYFAYHLSSEESLIFDIDDLFYYNAHRIHKRQGYYFVNDYGMQLNILNRYHIKNHAVEGRDYTFIDGDSHNFRYDNIHVINPYYGVILEKELPTPIYKALIHIHGNYIIGRYKTLETAAVAYNKTIDFLHTHHLSKKDFPKNYIESFTSEEYHHVYTKVSISKKIIALATH